MFAIFLQLALVSLSSVIMTGVMSFYDPASIGENLEGVMKLGVVGNTESPMLGFLHMENNVEVIGFDSIDSAENAFSEGDVDAVMTIPYTDSGVMDVELILPESDTKSTLILAILDRPLKEAEDFLRAINGVDREYPLAVGGETTTSSDYEFLYTVVIPLLMLFPTIIAGSIVIDTVSEELEHNTLDTLWSTPLSLNQILFSKVFAALITVLLQCTLWIVLLRVNGFTVENFGPVLLLALLVAGSISFGAALLGIRFKSREKAQFMYALMLLLMAGLCAFLQPSPFVLLTGLASGSQQASSHEVLLYILPLLFLGGSCFLLSKRLVLGELR